MKIFKFILSATIFLLMVTGLYVFNIYSNPSTPEIYDTIEKSKTIKKVEVLIIGDSTGDQLYGNKTYNGDIYSLACNAALSMAGHYFLLHNFIESNQNNLPDKVILIYHPLGLTNNLDKWAYNYFLKPFYNDEYIDLMNDYLKNRIKEIPDYQLIKYQIIKKSSYSPRLNEEPSKTLKFSQISLDYFTLMEQLCKKHDIPFEVNSPICSMMKREQITNTINSTNIMDSILVKYTKNISFVSDSLFVYDGLHMKPEHVPIDYFGLVQ